MQANLVLRTMKTDHKDRWGYGFSYYDYDKLYIVKPLKITDHDNFLEVFVLLPYYQMLGKPLSMTAKTSMHALDIQCYVHSRDCYHSLATKSHYDPLVIVHVCFSYRVNLKVEI